MPEVLVAIGSNMGDRVAHLQAGVSCLEKLTVRPLRLSNVYESEPIGPGSGPFLNAVVSLWTSKYPGELLPILKRCESERGRDPNSPRWTDRQLDMDIIGWGRRKFRTAELQVPHASYHDRLFVLLPLRDVSPAWTDPATDRSIDELVASAMPMQIQVTGYKLKGA